MLHNCSISPGKPLAEMGKIGGQALAEMVKKVDDSPQRRALGRPPVNAELEALVVRFAQENRRWAYDRIVCVLAHLGYTISDQTGWEHPQAPGHSTGP